MMTFTDQERRVVIFIGLVFVVGYLLDLSSGTGTPKGVFPALLDDPSFYPRININRASVEEMRAGSRMNEAEARMIIDHRKRHGPFRTMGDVQSALGLRPSRMRRLSAYCVVR